MRAIPYGRQFITKDDIAAVTEVLTSDWLTQGPAIERFERSVAEYCGAKYAVAVNSATAALHIGCLALGMGEGDILWTSPNTFVASANCGRYCGSTVDFVDIDPKTYNMSIEALEQKLQSTEKANLPKVVIPVHLSGQSCDMAKIKELADSYGFSVMEDASHAIGGRYRETKVGSCAFSDMTVFSFHPVKIVTTGEGGMVVTNNKELYDKLVLLRSHGITRDPAQMEGLSHGPWYYQQIELGFNYRMTDLQAALGASQMQLLDEFVARRHEIAKRYENGLKELPLTLPWQQPDVYSAYHLFVIRLNNAALHKSHRQVFEELRDKGVLVNLHYIPVHLQPYYQKMGFAQGDFPEAERYYAEAISLPMYYGLSEAEQEYVIETLREILA